MLNFQVGGVPASGDPVSIDFTIASIDPGTVVTANQTGPATSTNKSFPIPNGRFSIPLSWPGPAL